MQQSAETQYLALLQDITANGRFRADRTGVGAKGVFGRQLRSNLAEEFPLLTTKKLFTRGIIEELLWFLAGDTNVKTLQDKGVKIWDEWADPETGELGPIYSHLWRRFGAKPKGVKRRYPKLRKGLEPTYLGAGNGAGKQDHTLGKTWEGMMARCYDKNSTSYATYGFRGVIVCDRWLEFAAFAEDAKLLPGWVFKDESLLDPEAPRYVIDKDLRGDGFTYGPEHCAWVTDELNQHLREDTLYTVEKDGVSYQFTNVRNFCDEHNAEATNFSDLWTGRKNAKVRNGFRFVSAAPLRPGVDQITALVAGLKRDPNSRRHIVTGWDPSMLHLMALPPCHCLFQFYTEEMTVDERMAWLHANRPEDHAKVYASHDCRIEQYLFQLDVPKYRLSCQLYQRSCDIFLGVPFNIASYALLTMMVAQCVNMAPGEFIHTYGDLHIYTNHVDQVAEQLSREPRKPPTMKINPEVKDIFSFKVEDFTLEGYDPHPAIKGGVAV